MTFPSRLGRYRIERKLGEGGMGVVYLGYDERLERPLALKTIRGTAGDEKLRQRLWREARAAARVRHPGVCHLYEIDSERDILFIAMEFLEGESLGDRLARGFLPLGESVSIALEILSALEALHAEHIVHRDLKPSNVFLTPHGVKLLDFGLARTVESEGIASEEATLSQLTQAGAIVGTPQYMAPEQFEGVTVDPRADLFATAAIVFEMMTGKRAFSGRNPGEVYHKIRYEAPPVLGGSPAVMVVDRVVRRALAKRPEDRFGSASEMAEALREALSLADSGETPHAHRVSRLMVLPFRMLRPQPDVEFLAISIPEAVTISLAAIDSLVVRSTALTGRFAAETLDLERIAKEAEVDVVLTGTILAVGDQLRVTTQLVEVPSGTVLWSAEPRMSSRDAFELQDRIVQSIVSSLSLQLTAREHRRLQADVPASPTAYEFFLRANQLLFPQALVNSDDMKVARDLYTRALAEDPRYAPGWARLGRCHYLIGKGGEEREENLRRAESCFARALELNPDLASAHHFYSLLEIDQGKALDAMVRLVRRALSSLNQTELFASLVQACRYCGLLEASVAAWERVRALDPSMMTSVYQSFWQLGDERRALELGKRVYYLDGLVLAMNGNVEEAISRLREREKTSLPQFTRCVSSSLRALLEGRREESLAAAEWLFEEFPDPEAVYYLTRHLAYFGETERALYELDRVLDRGFIVYRVLMREDPWLDSLRSSPRFDALVGRAKERYRQAAAAFREAGGERLLGVRVIPQ